MHIRRIGDAWRVLPDGKPPVDETAEQDRRLIWIPAVPSSGTSCVAGILHHLGVDMGKVHDEQNFNRGYQMFEDLDVGLFAYIPNSDLDRLLNQRVRFAEYCNFRLAESPPGRIGVKALPTAWIWCDDPKRLPVDVLNVTRPLKDAVDADQKRMSNRPNRVADAQPATAFEHLKRAGGLTSMDVARDMLLSIHPPKLTLEFYDVLAEPLAAIESICGAFDLQPTDEQIDDALRFVKPKPRTV
jgi:hypothetical protein